MNGNDRLSGDSTDSVTVVRQHVANNLRLVVIALLVLAVIGGWVTYSAHVNPPTERDERAVGAVETQGEYRHGAEIRKENPIYPVGSNLQNRRHYFYSISPVLNGTFTHEYAANGSDVVVETTLYLRLRSADNEGEYWSFTEPLADRRIEPDDAEGTVDVPFEVNVTDSMHRIAETAAQLGGSPGDPELVITTETIVSATVEGERMTTTTTHELPITSSGSTYTVGPAKTDTASEQITRAFAVPREYGPITSYGAVLSLLGAVVSLGLVIGLHRRGALQPSEPIRAAAATARERKKLDEWITTGRIPATYRNSPFVLVTSLSGLVDIAIDSDRRVIEDDEHGGFYVVDDDVLYAFEPEKDATNSFSVTEGDEPSGSMDEESDWTEANNGDDAGTSSTSRSDH